jgi:hypothetical protein
LAIFFNPLSGGAWVPGVVRDSKDRNLDYAPPERGGVESNVSGLSGLEFRDTHWCIKSCLSSEREARPTSEKVKISYLDGCDREGQ